MSRGVKHSRAAKEAARSSTPARALAPERPERIAIIAGMMERLEWVRGKSGPKLAEQWGLDEITVRGDAAEASRRVQASPEEVRLDITTLGGEMLRAKYQEGDARGFAAVGKLLADVSGANAPTKLEAKLEYESVDIEQLRALLRPLGWDIVPLAIETQGEEAKAE